MDCIIFLTRLVLMIARVRSLSAQMPLSKTTAHKPKYGSTQVTGSCWAEFTVMITKVKILIVFYFKSIHTFWTSTLSTFFM